MHHCRNLTAASGVNFAPLTMRTLGTFLSNIDFYHAFGSLYQFVTRSTRLHTLPCLFPVLWTLAPDIGTVCRSKVASRRLVECPGVAHRIHLPIAYARNNIIYMMYVLDSVVSTAINHGISLPSSLINGLNELIIVIIQIIYTRLHALTRYRALPICAHVCRLVTGMRF